MTGVQNQRFRKKYPPDLRMVNMFSDQFHELFPKKIFSADFRPEIDDIGKKHPPKWLFFTRETKSKGFFAI